MTVEFKTGWRKRFLRAMKGSRRCRNKKDASVDAGNNPESDKDSNAVSLDLNVAGTMTDVHDRSPKKRRATSNIASIPTNISIIKSPSEPRYRYDTPPPGLNERYSPPPPPRLKLYNKTIDISSNQPDLLLPALPSHRINSSYSDSGSRFTLNPRLNWNIHSVSRQLRRSETTMSSLLYDENFSSEDRSCSSMTRNNSDCNESPGCTRDTATQLVRPTPVRGSANTVGSTAINLECDNVTFTNIMNEMPCCTWFNSSWTSAFDKVEEPRIQRKNEKKLMDLKQSI